MLCNQLINIFEEHIHPNLIGDELLYSALIDYKILSKYDEIVSFDNINNKYFTGHTVCFDENKNIIFKLDDGTLIWQYDELWKILGDLGNYCQYPNNLTLAIQIIEEYLLNLTNKHHLLNKLLINSVGWEDLKRYKLYV